VNLEHQLTHAREAFRIPEAHIELRLEGLLVPVLPRGAFGSAGNLDVELGEGADEHP
jgi:hypothetical protein